MICPPKLSFLSSSTKDVLSFLLLFMCYGRKTRVAFLSKQMLAHLEVEVITLASLSSWWHRDPTVTFHSSRNILSSWAAPGSPCWCYSIWTWFLSTYLPCYLSVSNCLCLRKKFNVGYLCNCGSMNLSWTLCQVSETSCLCFLPLQLIAGNYHNIIWTVQGKSGPYSVIITTDLLINIKW